MLFMIFGYASLPSRSIKWAPAKQAALRRDMLEELMDDEDEVRDMNLSSRPSREERRRVREREKIERGMERWGPFSATSILHMLAWASKMVAGLAFKCPRAIWNKQYALIPLE